MSKKTKKTSKPKLSLMDQLRALIVKEANEGTDPRDILSALEYDDTANRIIRDIVGSIPHPSTKAYDLYLSKSDKTKVLDDLEGMCLSVAAKNTIRKALK